MIHSSQKDPDAREAPYHVPYFDGLRGVGALMVFLAHISTSVLRGLASGKQDQAAGSVFSETFSSMPMVIHPVANFAVCIFFVLSGHVMAMLCMRSRESLIAICLRRYLRLALPAAASCLLSVGLLGAGLYYNQAIAEYTRSTWLKQWFAFEPSVQDALSEGLVQIFLIPESIYNSSLWTMYTELWGSFLVFLIYFLVKNDRVRVAVVLILMGLSLYLREYGFLCFLSGTMSFNLLTMYQRTGASMATGLPGLIRPISWVSGVLVTGGVYLGLYPDLAPYDGHGIPYGWLPVLSGYWYHAAGAILVVHFMGSSGAYSKLFSAKPALYLGRISFSLYLIHLPIICSFLAWMVFITRGHVSYLQSTVPATIVTIIVTLFAADLFHRFIDLPAIRFGKRVSAKLDAMLPLKTS